MPSRDWASPERIAELERLRHRYVQRGDLLNDHARDRARMMLATDPGIAAAWEVAKQGLAEAVVVALPVLAAALTAAREENEALAGLLERAAPSVERDWLRREQAGEVDACAIGDLIEEIGAALARRKP